MFSWIVDAIWGAISTVAGWLLSLLVWLFEYLYEFISEIFNFLNALSIGFLKMALAQIGRFLPAGWDNAITGAYEYVGYIDYWVPLSYCLDLFMAYYSIKSTLLVFRLVLRVVRG